MEMVIEMMMDFPPPECMDPKDESVYNPSAMESRACCSAIAKGMSDDACSRDELTRKRLENLAERARQSYAELRAAVCSANEKCRTAYNQNSDVQKFVCGEPSVVGNGWRMATIILAVVLGILLSLYVIGRRSGGSSDPLVGI